MKYLLVAAGLLVGAGQAWGQPTYKGPETATPVKWESAIVLHTTDSASVAYAKALRSLLSAGYGIERSDKEGLYITTSTPGKSLDGSIFLIIRVAITPEASGSEVAFRGVYTWRNATTIMAERQDRQMPVQFIGSGNSPTQRAWNGLHEAALAAAPQARVGYK